MFREGDVIRVRDDFDWHSDSLYVSAMEGLGGKYGRVRSVHPDGANVEVDEDSGWLFLEKDLEKVPYQEGDQLRVLPGTIERDGDNLYFPGMRNFEDTIVDFIHFESFGDRQTAYCKGTRVDGTGEDYWTFFLTDLEPAVQEVFNEEISLDELLQPA